MRELFAATVSALTLTSAAALAADMPTKAPAYTGKGPAVSAFDWSGFYVGGQVGYGWGEDPITISEAGSFFGPVGSRATTHPHGLVGGGQIGANLQSGAWVIGVEASLAGASVKGSAASPVVPGDIWSARLSVLGTATARLGYAMGAALPYIKGGYAGGKVRSGFECPATPASCVTSAITANDSNWNNGWTVGAGIEYMVAPNWTVGIEYAYVDLGGKNHNAPTLGGAPPPGGSTAWADDPRMHTAMFRVNYKFGGPVRAAY